MRHTFLVHFWQFFYAFFLQIIVTLFFTLFWDTFLCDTVCISFSRKNPQWQTWHTSSFVYDALIISWWQTSAFVYDVNIWWWPLSPYVYDAFVYFASACDAFVYNTSVYDASVCINVQCICVYDDFMCCAWVKRPECHGTKYKNSINVHELPSAVTMDTRK